MAPWRLLVFVAALLLLKGTLSSEEVKDVHVLTRKAWLNEKNLNDHSSGSDSEQHMKHISDRDESTTNEDLSLYSDEPEYSSEAESTEDNHSQQEEQTVAYRENDSVTGEDNLPLISDEQDYIKNEVESIGDGQAQLQEETVTYTGKNSIKLKDIFGDNLSQHNQGEKRSVRHDDWYKTDVLEPHWYKDSGEYYDNGNNFEKITYIPNKFSNTFYYKWPATIPYYLKSHKGFSTATEEYLEDDTYNEHLPHFEEYPWLYRVQLHSDHHYNPLKNTKLISYTHGSEEEIGQKLTTLSDGTFAEKDIYYNKGIRIDEPERVKHINPHHNVFHQRFPVNHNSIKTIFNSKDEITSHGTILEDGPGDFLKETKHIHLAVENDDEDSQSKKLFYEPFYSNNKIIHSDSLIVKSQPRDGLELKKYTPLAILGDIYKTYGYLPGKYGDIGIIKCHCYKDVDEGGLFRYHENYMLNKHNAKDTSSYEFLEDWAKQPNDLTESDEADVNDTYDSIIKHYPNFAYDSEEDKVIDYTDKQDNTEIIHEVDLKDDILDDQIINVHHTEVDPHVAAIDSDIAEMNEEITEEVADKYVQVFHPHSTNTVEEDGFFSKTQNDDHIEFVENDNLKVENLNDKIIQFQEMETTVLDQPTLPEEITETVGLKSIYEDHPHDTYSLEDKFFDHTENQDHKDIVERVELNIGTLNDKISKLHEIDMTVEDAPIKSEEIIEEKVDSEVKYHPYDIYGPKEDSITDYKGNHEYMEATDKETVEFATVNNPIMKLHGVNKLISDKPKITEETVEEAVDSLITHHPQHSHGPEQDDFFGYAENHGYKFTENEGGSINDEIIKFHEKEGFAIKKPMVYEEIIKEVGEAGVKYHPDYDYSSEEENVSDYIRNGYHTGVTKTGHLITDTFDEQIIKPHETEKVPGITLVALNKPMIYEEISEVVEDNAPHSYHPYYIHGEDKKEVFHHNENHGYSEVFKSDNWKFDSVSDLSDQIMKFHETGLPPKSDHIVSNGYSVNDEMVTVPQTGSYLIPGSYQDKSEISLSKNAGALTFDTEYDSRVAQTAFLNKEHTDDIPQSETYKISGEIPYTRPFLLKEISEYDHVETLDEDNDEIDIDIGFPFLYEKEKGHHLEKFVKNEDSAAVTDNSLEEADSVLVSENTGNEVLEGSKVVEDVGTALLLERTHSKQLTEHDVARETDLEHDAIYALKNADYLELPNESTFSNSGIESAVQYETEDKFSTYNEEMNYEVGSAEHVYDEEIDIPNSSPYEYHAGYVWNNAANKHYDQDITEGDVLQEKELLHANVAKYDFHNEAERPFIDEKNFKVTDDDYPAIKAISVPFSEKYGSIMKYFPVRDNKIVQHHLHTKEPTNYDYNYSEDKHNNDPFFVEKNRSETEQVAHDYNVDKNMVVKGTEFSVDSFKIGPRPCSGYKCLPFHKYHNDPFFVDEKIREIEQVGHDYNVESNVALKGTEFSLGSFKSAARPCNGYRCLPFYKYNNDPFFVGGKSRETEKVGHVYNVEKNIAVKGKEFSLDSFKGAPRACNGYRCLPFYFSLYYPYLRGDMPHWQTTSGTKYLNDLYPVPTSSNPFIITAGVKKYPWPFHTLLQL